MIKLNGITIAFKKFPNGETYADIENHWVNEKENEIELKFESDDDLTHLVFLKDCVDCKAPLSTCSLVVKYLPYERMDRAEEKRLFTLKSVARLINSLKFTYVEVWEPHSDVSVALIDRVRVINKSAEIALRAMMYELDLVGTAWLRPEDYGDCLCQGEMFRKAEAKGIYFVYPDAGASKRYEKQIKYPYVITCNKVREFNTGRIKHMAISNIEDAKKCRTAIIVDDLCSKGGTFIMCANALKELGVERVILAVTHCEKTVFDGSLLTGEPIEMLFTTESILCNRFNELNGKQDYIKFVR